MVLVNYVRSRLDTQGKLLHVRGESVAVDPVPLLEMPEFTVDSCTSCTGPIRRQTAQRRRPGRAHRQKHGCGRAALLPPLGQNLRSCPDAQPAPTTAERLTAYYLSPQVAKACSLW